MAHNCLLLLAGVVAGCAGTLGFQALFGTRVEDTPMLVESTPGRPAGRRTPAPVTAAELAVKLSQVVTANDREHKAEDLRRLGREAATGDRDEALRLARNLASDADRSAYMKGVAEAMAEKDAAAAAEFFKDQMSPGARQAEALRIALGVWGGNNPREAYAWAESNLSGPVKDEAVNALVQSWAGKSPEAAAAWFEQTGSTSQSLLAALAGSWAATNPHKAASWVETLADKASRDAGRVVVAGEWASQNPEEAAANYTPAISTPPPPGESPSLDLPTVLADIWGTSDPAGAAKWVQQLPAGAAREQAAGTLATVWAASDIQSAVAWSNSITDPAIRSAVVDHIATTWGAIDPDKTLAWLDTQPPALAASGYRGAWNSWAATDPAGLQDWITQMPPGPSADLARRSLGEVQVAREPLAALETAFQISDPATQSDALARYYHQFLKADAPSATEWLASEWNRIPASVQQRITKESARP